jgi:tetratricopeptide (TPR) repeat protein
MLDKCIYENSRALELDQYAPYVFNNAGLVYLKQNMPDEAIRAFNISIERDPAHAAVAYSNLCLAYLRKSEYLKAVESAKKALELNPYADEALFNLARSLALAGQDDDAIKAYEKYLKVNHKTADAYLNLGSLYFKKGNIQGAEKLWEQAFKINPALYKDELKNNKGKGRFFK